jgi:crossover junction endodeoxyribonuclease RuvC
MSDRRALCLDLGGHFGYCVVAGSSVVDSGSVKLADGKDEFKSMHKLVQYRKWLDVNTVGIDEVYFELVNRHVGTIAAHMYGAYWGITAMVCIERNIPWQGISVTANKKNFTGVGLAKKQDMIDTCAKYGYDPQDENEADAIGLAYYVADVLWRKKLVYQPYERSYTRLSTRTTKGMDND